MFNGVEETRPVVGFRGEEILRNSRPEVGLYRQRDHTRFQTDRIYLENTSRAPPDRSLKIRRKRFWGSTSSKS